MFRESGEWPVHPEAMSNDVDKDKKEEKPEEDFGDIFADEEPAKPEERVEEDFGGLFDDEGGAEGKVEEREMDPGERAWRESIKADMERNIGMRGVEFQVQTALVEALADELKEAQPEEVTGRMKALQARMELLRELQVGRLEKQERVPEEVSSEEMQVLETAKSANKTEVMLLMSGKGERLAVYKPRDGRNAERMREDPFDAVENRIRKEWLGTQIDLLFNVDRSPVATVQDAGPDKPGGSVVEFRHGTNGKEVLWEEKVSDDEISRVADYHYLIWETDGHDEQYILEDDGRLTTIDRGESFMEGQQPLRSEAVMAARGRGLKANPEVLASANRFVGSKEMQAASEQAFISTFGAEEGKRRHTQLVERAKRYVEHKGVPDDVEVVRTPNSEEIRQERLQRLKGSPESAG